MASRMEEEDDLKNVSQVEAEMVSDHDSCEESSDSDSESESEEIKESKIRELLEKITANPYHYASHLELITLLRKGGELEQLRSAREKMSQLFPLTPELWMEWLTDESIVASQKGDRKELLKLFEKAIKDYLSVPLWLEFVQFSIGAYSSELAKIRDIFERALVAAGLHVTDGAMLWEAYREYEIAILASLQSSTAHGDEESNDVSQQKKRVLNLFRRQLSVPLIDMEKTYEEYREWVEGEIDPNIKNSVQKALKKLEALKPFESSLLSSEAPHLNEYLSYIEHEVSKGEPARVQCIFERALAQNCLLPDLWLKYTEYLNSQLKIGEIVLGVHERSVRNCPWSIDLWLGYIQAAEEYHLESEKIKSIVDNAFQSGLSSAEELRSLWIAFLDYLRRNIDWKKGDEEEKAVEQLRIAFQKSCDHLNRAFGVEGDPNSTILKYWATVEAKFCTNVPKSREIWNAIMNFGDHKQEAEMWMEYAQFERKYGDDKKYRKILLKGLTSASDWPELPGEALVTFESQEGSLESLKSAKKTYSNVMAKVNEKRMKLEEELGEKNFLVPPSRQHFKRKFVEESGSVDSDGFRIPKVKESANQESPQQKKPRMSNVRGAPRKGGDAKKMEPLNRKVVLSNRKVNPSNNKPEQKREGRNLGSLTPHDPLRDKMTVFVSNLDFSAEEEEIKQAFVSIGNIEEVRLVRNYKGNSKGYCYVVFKTEECVEVALKRDRELLKGRPMFISPCKDKSSDDNQQQKFKFNTCLEKNKLFIRGLPFSTTQSQLEDLFKQYGELKETRLVTYRNGHSKGLAYVEFIDECAATTALAKTDGMEIGSQKIIVAYSNPPTRKPRGGFSSSASHALSNTQENSVAPIGRGRGRPQMLMVPRSLQRVKPGEETEISNGNPPHSSNGAEKKMSNQDFRKLINK